MIFGDIWKNMLCHTTGRLGFFFNNNVTVDVREVQGLEANIDVPVLEANIEVIELEANIFCEQ